MRLLKSSKRLADDIGYRISSGPSPPLGISIIAGMLAIIGLGSIAAGLYALLASGRVSLWAAATGLVAGPASLYLAFHLLRFAQWTWRTLMVVLVMLTISSIVRLVSMPEIVTPPVIEIVVEVVALFYLSRDEIRNRFRPPAA